MFGKRWYLGACYLLITSIGFLLIIVWQKLIFGNNLQWSHNIWKFNLCEFRPVLAYLSQYTHFIAQNVILLCLNLGILDYTMWFNIFGVKKFCLWASYFLIVLGTLYWMFFCFLFYRVLYSEDGSFSAKNNLYVWILIIWYCEQIDCGEKIKAGSLYLVWSTLFVLISVLFVL